MLHIVSGDCTIEALRDYEIEEDFISWMDVIHYGSVPEVMRIEQFSNIRAKLISKCDWDSFKNAKDSFRKMDMVFHN